MMSGNTQKLILASLSFNQ